MREELYYHLSNDAGISALVGDRIYPQRVATTDALPYIDFTFSDRDAMYDQDGYDSNNKATVIINSNATTLISAVAIAKAVFDSLDIQQQEIGDTGNKELLMSTRLETEFDNEDLLDGSEDGVRIVTQTYTLSYKEA
jgi:hypothetical protein